MSTMLPPRAELEAIATRAGRLALGHFRRVAPERKADRTLVTAADREVEAELVSALGALLPDAGIIGEAVVTWLRWLPVLTGALLWPIVVAVLDTWNRRRR